MEDVDHADDPVITAWIVVNVRAQEFHPAPAVPFVRQIADRILADFDGLLSGEAAGHSLGNAFGDDALGDDGWRAIEAAVPEEFEDIDVSSRTIVYANHRDPAVARVTDQVLPATPIDTLKAKLDGVTRERIGALETAPMRIRARDIPEDSLIAPDLDLRDSVDYYFYSALAAVSSTTTDQGGSAVGLLRSRRERNYQDCRDNCE
jgi:hypothetical protein